MALKEITLNSVVEKQSKAGKTYWQIEDDKGMKYSCFEEDVAKECMKNIENLCAVEVAQSGEYHNIRAFYSVVTKRQSEKVGGNTVEPKPNIKPTANPNELQASVLTSYIKDLMVAGMEKEEATNVIVHTFVDLRDNL